MSNDIVAGTDYIRSLLAERPDLNAEEFIARRILKHIGLNGKAAKTAAFEAQFKTLWGLAAYTVRNGLTGLQGLPATAGMKVAEVFACSCGSMDDAIEQLNGLRDGNPVFLFVRGPGDRCFMLAALARDILFTHRAFSPPLSLYASEEEFPAHEVIIQRGLDSFITDLLGGGYEDTSGLEPESAPAGED